VLQYLSIREKDEDAVFLQSQGESEEILRCSVLQRVAVHCSVLQCVAVYCSVLQCVALRCSALQCVAVRCSALQYVAVCYSVCCNTLASERRRRAPCIVCYSALQCVAVRCSVCCSNTLASERRRRAPCFESQPLMFAYLVLLFFVAAPFPSS